MLEIEGKICIEFKAKVSEHDLRNVPKYIDFLPRGEPMPAPTPLALTVPINEFGEVAPFYRDVFGTVCTQDGTTSTPPIPVVSPVFTPSNADTSVTLLSDGNAVIAELSTATPAETTNIAVVDVNGLKGALVITEGPSQANIPAFIDFTPLGVFPAAPTV